MTDAIPIVENYKGIGIHDSQPADRIASAVKPAIDRVLAMSDLDSLAEFAGDVTQPPEARLFAAAKLEAVFQFAVDERRERPPIDLDKVRAAVAGLNSIKWRSPWAYCSILSPGPMPGGVGPEPRVPPLPDVS
jgi:hypothetical protein